tara:strand:+ start:9221 stop:9928 length:708 start_codon:yes stop_codon:yes gene_type:complete
MKSHLKRLPSPKSWNIKRKGIKYITRPFPGGHPFKNSISINTFMKVMIKKAKTTKEVKKILYNSNILVDGTRVKEVKFLLGLMDTVSLVEAKKYYRIILNEKGQLDAIEITEKESTIKPCQLTGKTNLKKGKIQLHCSDGRNITIDKDTYKVQDSVLISLPKQEIKEHFSFDKNSFVFFVNGKYVGKTAIIDDIKEDKIICKINNERIETLKKFAFIIGKEKSAITLENESNANN